ncbi:uncharacterized protein LODBEIA_P59020 [Lodderomyces beijingensis]|uniref:Transcription regulator Rua1 C-terminal domain-containing protein n=1 Tax=Lodderomyces beijingensis TaxID=1775926 RepID=A0ABP0ZU68_9ASCO
MASSDAEAAVQPASRTTSSFIEFPFHDDLFPQLHQQLNNNNNNNLQLLQINNNSSSSSSSKNEAHPLHIHHQKPAELHAPYLQRYSHHPPVLAPFEQDDHFRNSHFEQDVVYCERPQLVSQGSQSCSFSNPQQPILADILTGDIPGQFQQSTKFVPVVSCPCQIGENYYYESKDYYDEESITGRSLIAQRPTEIPHENTSTYNGINLVPDQSFLTITSNCIPEDLVQLFQEYGSISEHNNNNSIPPNAGLDRAPRDCMQCNGSYDVGSEYDLIHSQGRFESRQGSRADASDAMAPETGTNAALSSFPNYLKFNPHLANAPGHEQIVGEEPTSESPHGDIHSPRGSMDLTHDQVIELFEETCKEIDEWKSKSQTTSMKKGSDNEVKIGVTRADEESETLDDEDDDDDDDDGRSGRGNGDGNGIGDNDNDNDNYEQDPNYENNFYAKGAADYDDDGDDDDGEGGETGGARALRSSNRLKLKTDFDPLISSNSPLVHPELDAAYLMNIVDEWKKMELNQHQGERSLEDENIKDPNLTSMLTASALMSSAKRSSSVSSLKSDTQSHLSFNQTPSNLISTLSSPLEKSNNSSGLSTPARKRKTDAPSKHSAVQRKKAKSESTSFNNNFNKIFFETTNVELASLDIESTPDWDYSATLPITSTNVPDARNCSQLSKKLIRPLFNSETCQVRRTMYLRDNLAEVFVKHFEKTYDLSPNSNFKKTAYESQYILTKLDRLGKPDNATRAGLCPYCESIEFFGLKNSSYGNHLAYKHGILTNGRAVPDPKYHGLYKFKKGEYDEPEKKRRKTNAHILEREGVLCTSCWQILEVNCTSRSSVLGHYLRHFRDSHVGYKKDNSRYQYEDMNQFDYAPDTDETDENGTPISSARTADAIISAFISKWNP